MQESKQEWTKRMAKGGPGYLRLASLAALAGPASPGQGWQIRGFVRLVVASLRDPRRPFSTISALVEHYDAKKQTCPRRSRDKAKFMLSQAHHAQKLQ